MKKLLFFVATSLLIISCGKNGVKNESQIKVEMNKFIDSWHQNAAEGNFDAYFDAIAEDGYFLGTDPSENWNKKQFMKYSKPHFADGSAWSFAPYKRNIYVYNDSNLVWFDELLRTPFGVCRGSGVICFEKDKWVIKHYNLALTKPNNEVKSIQKELNSIK